MVSQKLLESFRALPESATLEFKRDMPSLFDKNGEIQKRQRHEFIKDILSLVNGSMNTAGEKAYFVFGMDDKFNSGGLRDILGVHNRIPTQTEVFQIVNPYCFPKLDNLLCETIEMEGNDVFVITIFPSAHLHETTQQLETPKRRYTEFTMFIRRNESIDIASARDRAAIEDLKRVRIAENQRIDSTICGIITGSATGGLITGTLAPRWTANKIEQIGSGMGGVVVGGILGGSVGASISGLIKTREEIYTVSRQKRPLVVVALVLSSIGVTYLWQQLVNRVSKYFVSSP